MQQKRFTSLAIVGTLGLAGLGSGVAFVPALASAATNDTTAVAAATNRLSAIKNALSGLVQDKTLTQEQADKVASTLDKTLPQHRRSRGGHEPGGAGFRKPALEAAASALGLTETELREQLTPGKTLADVAKAEGIAVDTLIAKLVTAAEKSLAQVVEDGRLTQAQADERKADLKAHITSMVNRQGPPRGSRHRGDESGGTDALPPSPSSTTGV